jgi:hypothetical protein
MASRQEASASSLLRLLRGRGFALDAELEARVAQTLDLDQLDRWLDRVVGASSLEDVFRDG